MNYLINFSRRHPAVVSLMLLIATVIALYHCRKVHLDSSTEVFMVKNDPQRNYYQESLDLFGSDLITVVFIKDKNLFSPKQLECIDRLVRDLEQIKHVDKIESLFTLDNIKNQDGMLSTNRLMDYPPQTQEEADQILADAKANNIYRNNLVSDDGQSTSINIYMEPRVPDSDFQDNMCIAVEAVVEKYRSEFGEIFQLGTPYSTTTVSALMQQDQNVLFPVCLMVVLLTAAISMRSPSGAILPFLTTALSVIWTLGFMGYMDLPLTLLSFIIPSLVAVIGSTEDMHILSEYMEGMHECNSDRLKAIEYMSRKLGVALLLTSVTTFAGFISISANQIQGLREFGYSAGFGLFVNPLITVMVAPIYLRYFGPRYRMQTGSIHIIERLFEILTQGVIRLTTTRGRQLIVGFLAVAVFCVVLIPNVRFDNSIYGFFRKDSEIIRRFNVLTDELCGSGTFFLRIDGGHKGDFFKPENLEFVARVQDEMVKQGLADKTTSLTDYLKLINREMNDGNPEFYRIPDQEKSVSEYMLFLHRDDISTYITNDADHINILVRHHWYSSAELQVALDKLQILMDEIIPSHYSGHATGEGILVFKAADTIITGQVRGLVFIAVIVFLLISLLFLNMKAGFISLLPNLFPVTVAFATMALFDIPFNSGTGMVAVISVGIAIDDTVHFMARFQQEMRCLQNASAAIAATIRSEIRPAVCTSLALSTGFIVLLNSHFLPIEYFGFLSAVVMLCALMTDLLLTPTLLTNVSLINLYEFLEVEIQNDVVNKSALFQGMSRWQIKKIVLLGKLESFDSRKVAIREGEFGDSLLLILEGKADVFCGKDDTQVQLSSLSPGDVFGEVAFSHPGSRSATVIATEPLKAISLSHDCLNRISRAYPWTASTLLHNIVSIIGNRLGDTNRTIIASTQTNDLPGE